MNEQAGTIWPDVLRRYLLASLVLHAVWEIAQLPLYTIWSTGTLQERWFAVLHCTLGDMMIAGLALMAALTVFGRASWPEEGLRTVWLATLAVGLGYTVYSEWINVSVRGTWAYSALMPKLPFVGTGLSPLLQWLIVPTLSQWYAAGRKPWQSH